ncbi:MAG: hypothetical protein Q7S06_02710 [Nanoarchaeota archaeon]|nr:hypothetical protein [Nanoarchaeota archaeon]
MGKIILEYNGRRYYLRSGDIPNLTGSGKIEIVNKKNSQFQTTEGNFRDIRCDQVNGHSYINGVNIEDLIKRLDAER